jgi:hypothetical protein
LTQFGLEVVFEVVIEVVKIEPEIMQACATDRFFGFAYWQFCMYNTVMAFGVIHALRMGRKQK